MRRGRLDYIDPCGIALAPDFTILSGVLIAQRTPDWLSRQTLVFPETLIRHTTASGVWSLSSVSPLSGPALASRLVGQRMRMHAVAIRVCP